MTSQLVPISEAAKRLGVSMDTVRRWDRKGIIKSTRPDGKNRFFNTSQIKKFLDEKPLSISEAANELNVSVSTLRRLEKKNLIKPQRSSAGIRHYTRQQIKEYQKKKQQKPGIQVTKQLPPKQKLKHKPKETIDGTATSEPKAEQPDTNQLLATAISLLSHRLSKEDERISRPEPKFSFVKTIYALAILAIAGLTGLSIIQYNSKPPTPPTVIVQQVPAGGGAAADQITGTAPEGQLVATPSEETKSQGLIAGLASRTKDTLGYFYAQEKGRERAISIDEEPLSFDVYQPAKYLYVDLREDGTYFKVQDHGHDTLTVDYDKNIIAHQGSTLHLLGDLKDSTGSVGEGEQVFAVMGDGQLPKWTYTSDITAGDLACDDCLGTTEIEDIYVLKTGDAISGPLTIGNIQLAVTSDQTIDTLAGDLVLNANSGAVHVSNTLYVDSGTINLSGTGTLNGLDAIDATTETTLEGALDIAGDVTGTGLTAVTVAKINGAT
ncbi:MAG: MerR family DNA-binding transcriptional regulator, partial [bacterium]